MNRLLKKENLFLRVALGFGLGVVLGLAAPKVSLSTRVVGEVYLNLIRLMVLPVALTAVFCGITNIKSGALLRRLGLRTVALYVLMFLLSAGVSLCIAALLRPGRGLVLIALPVYEGEVAEPTVGSFLTNLVPTNLFDAAAKGNLLALILFAMALAVATVAAGEPARPLITAMNALSAALTKLLGYVMELSPLGVLSLMAAALAQYGAGIFGALARYILCCYACCLMVFVLVMVLPAWLYAKAPLKTLLTACGKIALVTLSTTSSAATLPTTLQVSLEDLQAPAGVSRFTLPLGCTINMCGGACSFCCLALFVADFYGVTLPLGTWVMLVLTATLMNMAAPGIPGGGVVLGASFLSLAGLPLNLMGPIGGIYRLLDMAFTTINVEGDVTANLILSRSLGQYPPAKE